MQAIDCFIPKQFYVPTSSKNLVPSEIDKYIVLDY